MSKKHLHIKQVCIIVPLGNDGYSLFKSSIPSKKMDGVFDKVILSKLVSLHFSRAWRDFLEVVVPLWF